MTLNGNYQFIGRSNAVFNYGSTYYYYLLLYAKTEPNTATGKHKVSLKMRVACQAGDGFYGYSTTGFGKVAGANAISWSAQYVPNGAWTTGSLTEGGVTYSRWVDLKEGSAEVNTGFGAAKNVTLEASFQRLDMASPPNHVPQTTPMTLSATVTLPAIAGVSVPTVSASSVAMGSLVTISTNRKSDAFTHDLTYSFGGSTGTIATGVGASYAWTVPDLVARIPNKTSGTCTITCKTKNGSTVIGTSTCTLTLTVPAKSNPTVSATSVAMGGSVTVNTNRKNTAFTHTLTYSFGGSTGTIATNVGASYAWTVPDLVAKIPNATFGSCTITCTTYNGTAQVGTDTCTLTLTVPAKSAPTVSAASVVIGSAVTIKTNRKSTGYLHGILISFNGQQVASIPNVGDSYTWTTASELIAKVPNATSGTCTITCKTFNGTAQVGSSDVSITLTVPDNASTKPAVTMKLKPVSSLAAAFSGLYIQNLTKVEGELSATGKHGASIKSYQMVLGNAAYGSPYTSGYLTQTGNVAVTGKATDSRGFVGTTTQNITVIPYSKPAIVPASGRSDILCARCDDSGNLSDSGTRLRIIAKRSYSTVTANGVQKNYCSIRYRVNSGSWATILPWNAAANEIDTGAITGVTLSATSSYTVEIGVVDDIGNSASVKKIIPTDKVDIHLREGGGVALGGYSTGPGFECYMDARFEGNVSGSVFGLGRKPAIPEGADIHSYIMPGNYVVAGNAVAETCVNLPIKLAGTLTVEWILAPDGVEWGQNYLMHAYRTYTGAVYFEYSVDGGSTWTEWTCPTVDYIVAQGTSGIWTYRKWNSGLAEIWGRVWQKVTYTTTNGSKHYSPEFTLNLPFALVGEVYVQASSPDLWADVGNVRAIGSTLNYKVTTPYQVTDVDYDIGCTFRVDGRWK